MQYNTMQYNAMQCNTMQYNAIQCNAIQCNTTQYPAIQCNTMQQYNAIQCNTMQCDIFVFCFVLCNIVHCALSFSSTVLLEDPASSRFCMFGRPGPRQLSMVLGPMVAGLAAIAFDPFATVGTRHNHHGCCTSTTISAICDSFWASIKHHAGRMGLLHWQQRCAQISRTPAIDNHACST